MSSLNTWHVWCVQHNIISDSHVGAVGVSRAQVFGPGFGIIYFDDVGCTGNEDRLTDCRHRGVAVSNCNHREDAGVVCRRKLHTLFLCTLYHITETGISNTNVSF